jgi:hypothetical protein
VGFQIEVNYCVPGYRSAKGIVQFHLPEKVLNLEPLLAAESFCYVYWVRELKINVCVEHTQYILCRKIACCHT